MALDHADRAARPDDLRRNACRPVDQEPAAVSALGPLTRDGDLQALALLLHHCAPALGEAHRVLLGARGLGVDERPRRNADLGEALWGDVLEGEEETLLLPHGEGGEGPVATLAHDGGHVSVEDGHDPHVPDHAGALDSVEEVREAGRDDSVNGPDRKGCLDEIRLPEGGLFQRRAHLGRGDP